ncbi:MAG: peptidyl-tRNA hydrolase Pth2 [Candidatus Thorarchaeota archaeon]
MGTREFEYKQVIVVRTDLGMSKGKTAVQVAHGAISAAERARITQESVWQSWLREGQKKVVVKVSTETELIDLNRQAAMDNFPHALIKDAGMTELPPGTATVVGIGPAKSDDLDRITKHLKLL